jgi:3-oxoacyl-[acyl-carrier-protein] synthase-3
MSTLKFENKRISGLLLVTPGEVRLFEDEMSNFDFPISRSLKLKEVMGYHQHQIVDNETCATDLAVFGLQHLFERNLLDRDGFEALVVVSQSPDQFIPSNSNIIQGVLELSEDMFCLDVVQGCAGYLIGLFQAFMMLEQPSINRVVLINVDVLSKKVSPRDRNSYPLIGDAASITIVEKGGAEEIFANLKMDGRNRSALEIVAGGFRLPSSQQTSVQVDQGDGNFRSQDNLRMDGGEVFNFVQTKVPEMIENLFAFSGLMDNDIDFYMFHQPNSFMLKKLAEKMGVSIEKMPHNVVSQYGNSSGVTIPTAIVSNLGSSLTSNEFNVCLAGFGVGLTWSSMVMKMGYFDFCEEIEYKRLDGNNE